MRTLAPALWLALAVPVTAFADGNVTTEQTAKSITIDGDDAANEYEVKYGTDDEGNDVLILEGKNGTTINGTPTFEIRLNAGANRFTDVEIKLSAGADQVTVDLSGVPAEKRFDEVKVNGSEASTTTIKNVQSSAGGEIVVNPGGAITVEGCDTTDLKIKGSGGGSITVKNCNVEGKFSADTRESDAEITVQDSFLGGTSFKGGGKVDVQNRLRARIQRTNAGKVSFQSGVGDDEVAFEDSSVEQLSAKLGDGADLVFFSGSELGKTSLDGGAGALDCFDDTMGGNTFAALKTKGFEDGGCSGLVLEFGDPGQDPFADPPEGAVAWLVSNGSHEDGPFALPGAENPEGLPELDPTSLPPPAHWGQGPECVDGMTQLFHVHDDFDDHDDPDESGCGHGVLSWGFLVPI